MKKEKHQTMRDEITEYASLKLSLLAKQKGFDWECTHVYRDDKDLEKLQYYEYGGEVSNDQLIKDEDYTQQNCLCVAPTLNMLVDWFRREKNIIILIQPYFNFGDELVDHNIWDWELSLNGLMSGWISEDNNFNTYEEALEASLIEAFNRI